MIAPELQVSKWFNTKSDITLSALRGKVVAIEAFQMLCPGCVSHGLPLAEKIRQTFPTEAVVVLGLHTVFEHHDAMTPVSLAAFLHEYRIMFPVGVDTPGKGHLPLTMEAYRMRGTPSMILVDKSGHLRSNHFGGVSELQLGAEIGTLLGEPYLATTNDAPDDMQTASCDETGCPV